MEEEVAFDAKFGQDLCDLFTEVLGYKCIFATHGGIIVSSSARDRIGTTHAMASRIMAGEIAEYGVTAQEAEASGGLMREGLNLGIDFDNKRLINFGIAGPLAVVTPLARIVGFCVSSLLHARQAERKMVTEFAHEASGLGVRLCNVVNTVEEVSIKVSDQTKLLTKLQQGMRDLSSRNSSIVDVVGTTRETANSAAHEMVESHEQIRHSLTDVQQLAQMVAEGKAMLQDLRAALESVGNVAGTINLIARQTNLLALNATIEAARAGDAGKGFAVVASEVKTLSRQTREATNQISHTLNDLSANAMRLISQGEASDERARSVGEQTSRISNVINNLASAIAAFADDIGRIDQDASGISQQSSGLIVEIDDAAEGIKAFNENIAAARKELDELLNAGERLITLTAESGVETADTPYINYVCKAAADVSKTFEEAVQKNEISLEDLFDENYRVIPGSDPEQKSTRFCDFTDRIMPQFQEAALSFNDRVVFCAAVDRNGYLPTHNKKFSHPQGSDPVWNNANCRNRRIFDDKTGISAARNQKPFLAQTYRRDMGGGKTILMIDVSSPIMVGGRHWGALRLAYKV